MALRLTGWENPFTNFTDRVDVAVEPEVKLTGFVALIAKSGGAKNVNVTVAVSVREPLVPVIATE